MVEQWFWLDGDGPVAAAVLTDWGGAWACDPIVRPGAHVTLEAVWSAGLGSAENLGLDALEWSTARV